MIKRTKTKKISFGGKGYGLKGLSLESDEIKKIKKLLAIKGKSGKLDPGVIRTELAKLQRGSIIQRRKIGGSVNKPKLSKAFKELKKNPPFVLRKTRRKKGKARANKQRVAIAYSKARKRKKV
jgi:hypothetical protein